MGTEWQGSLPVDASLARSLIDSQFPALRGIGLERVGSGWDHVVWRCGETLFRFPHQAESLDLARRSVQALGHLSTRLPLLIPTPTHQGVPEAGYPGHFVGYRWLEGALPAQLPLTEADRRRATPKLAAFLRTLHGIALPEARAWGVPLEDDKGSMVERTEYARKRARQLADTRWAQLGADALAVMEQPPPEASDSAFRLVHGDLHSGQVLFDTSHTITAVIDWDELAIGDPAFDLIMVYSFVPPMAREDFWHRYGDRTAAARARHLALSYGLAILVQALHTEDPVLRDEAAAGLENALTGSPTRYTQ